MHPLVKNAEYAVRGALPIRAEALSQVRIICLQIKKMKVWEQLIDGNLIFDLSLAIKEGSFKVEL